MTRPTFILFLALTGALLTAARPHAKLKAPAARVYICNSEGSVAYHGNVNQRHLSLFD